MKIETHLQPNCSESSWRLTGPKQNLEKIKKKFLAIMNGDQHTQWIGETLLLQTTDQHAAGEYYQKWLLRNPRIKVYEDEEEARDCTCGGDWCPEPKWIELTNVDKLVKGLVKPVKAKK